MSISITEKTPILNTGRRAFLQKAGVRPALAALAATGIAHSASAQSRPTASADLLKLSATEVAKLIREKKVSSVELVKACYERIDAVNPRLNAVVMQCRERAMKEAQEADAALARGQIKGPLHGVPMTIKDSLDTEGVVTTGGTQGRANFVPKKDATCVARLRAAGAILLGKTNTPEFTIGGIGGLGTTANLVYGFSKNPYDLERSTSGSSGGAGAIVAAYGAYFDIGTDFGGSIRGPAHANGIAGIKPQTGRVPRTGHIVDYGGVFDSYQQVGPMTRSVEDLDLITKIISGPDSMDAAIQPMPWPDYKAIDVKKLRVAYYLSHGPGSVALTPETKEMVLRSAKYFSDLGCSVEESMPPRLQFATELNRQLREGDGNSWQKRLVERYGTKVPGPARRFDFPMLPTAEFTRLLEERDAWKSEMLQWVKNYDVILCPVSYQEAPLIGEQGGPSWGTPGSSYTSHYNMTGWPAGVVRAGTAANGMPLGLHVIAQPWREDVVFAAMQYVESKTGGWKAPLI